MSTAVSSQAAQLSCGASPTPSPCTAKSALTGLSFGGQTASLCNLFTINGSACSGSGSTLSYASLAANLDVLQFLTTEGEVANGSGYLDLGTSLGLTGVTDAKLQLVVGQLPQVAYGPVGTTATSAQITADLLLSVLGDTVNIPLTAADGTASLTSVTCSQSNNAFNAAVVTGSTTAATAAITLSGVSGYGTTAIANASVSGVGNTAAGFTSNNVPPSASTFGGPNPNPFQIGLTSPTVTITTDSGLPVLINTVVTALSSGVFSQLSTALAPMLQAAGVTVAGADIADLSVNCGAVSLFQ